MVGGGYLVSWREWEDRGSTLCKRTKPSSGRRPSWQRRKPELAFFAEAVLEMKIGLVLMRGFAAVLPLMGFFFFLSPPMIRLYEICGPM